MLNNFKTPKIRSKRHLAYVASLPCLVNRYWDKTGVPHHLLRAGGKAGGIKECDSLAIPLLHLTHRMLHESGNEVVFLLNNGWPYLEVLYVLRDQIIPGSPNKKIRESVAIHRAIQRQLSIEGLL